MSPEPDSQVPERKTSRKGHIIATAIFLVIALGRPFYLRHAAYQDGLTNSGPPVFFWGLGSFAILLASAVALLVYGLIRTLLDFRDTPRRALASLAITAVGLLGCVVSLSIPVRAMRHFRQGYAQWAGRNVDIEAIQDWLASEGSTFAEEHGRRHEWPDDPNIYPVFLIAHKPHYLFFHEPANGAITVEVEWGGALLHWGFAVGPPAQTPPETGAIREGGLVEFRYPVAPGAYIYTRG